MIEPRAPFAAGENTKPIPDNPLGALKAMNSATAEKVKAKRDYLGSLDYLLPNYIAKGHITVIVAHPNGAKTLHMCALLKQQLDQGIDLSNVYYFNEDDSAFGSVSKSEIFQDLPINFITGSEQEKDSFYSKPSDLYDVMDALIQGGQANGVVIILDTLKKFMDVMRKGGQSSVGDKMQKFRAFTQAGGTIIGLAHANKGRDEEGRPIFAGVQDLEDDIDQMYFLSPETEKEDTEQVVAITLGKERYPAHSRQLLTYSKPEGARLPELMNSCKFFSGKAVEDVASILAGKQCRAEFNREFGELVQYVDLALEEAGGTLSKTKLEAQAHKLSPKQGDGELEPRALSKYSAKTLVGKLITLGYLQTEGQGRGLNTYLNPSFDPEQAPWEAVTL